MSKGDVSMEGDSLFRDMPNQRSGCHSKIADCSMKTGKPFIGGLEFLEGGVDQAHSELFYEATEEEDPQKSNDLDGSDSEASLGTPVIIPKWKNHILPPPVVYLELRQHQEERMPSAGENLHEALGLEEQDSGNSNAILAVDTCSLSSSASKKRHWPGTLWGSRDTEGSYAGVGSGIQGQNSVPSTVNTMEGENKGSQGEKWERKREMDQDGRKQEHETPLYPSQLISKGNELEEIDLETVGKPERASQKRPDRLKWKSDEIYDTLNSYMMLDVMERRQEDSMFHYTCIKSEQCLDGSTTGSRFSLRRLLSLRAPEKRGRDWKQRLAQDVAFEMLCNSTESPLPLCHPVEATGPQGAGNLCEMELKGEEGGYMYRIPRFGIFKSQPSHLCSSPASMLLHPKCRDMNL